jgi:hypothetical protein
MLSDRSVDRYVPLNNGFSYSVLELPQYLFSLVKTYRETAIMNCHVPIDRKAPHTNSISPPGVSFKQF